ncbi:Homeobox-leucine zipper protein ATHB-16 [Mucuna pruriens]|uniref:Homeobox-leucine zipper protein n=1 Tax=Mucuna pruriens TaxID=157652 RepID=A0A371I2X8_MUCPR|nr:Homeobox-leucine zipper protein ATHB-16 [Mucuna pruriens]
MKRLGSSDSLGALITICPPTEEQSPRKNRHVYGREFQSMLEGLDEEGCVEEAGQHAEKKRRLSVDQVKALEKNFEVENKLEPDRKVKLAHELGLQPRQVAVWFQNRRARWKTKQLERDYGVLKSNYETLKLSYDTLQQDNQALLKEIKELKSRVEGENTESDASVKEEMTTVQDSDPLCETAIPGSDSKVKDGSSDSDSSAILNDENNNNAAISSCGILQSDEGLVSSPSCFQYQKQYQTQYVKMEEHNFLSADEACNFFSDEQPPTLQWYCSEEWG